MSRKVANLKWHPGWLKSIYNQVFGSKMTKQDLVAMLPAEKVDFRFFRAGIFDLKLDQFQVAQNHLISPHFGKRPTLG